MNITVTEFARRICVANHATNHLHQGKPIGTVPCQEHRTIANQSWGLIQTAGHKTLDVILAVARENGWSAVEDDLPPFLRDRVPASSRFPAEPAVGHWPTIDGGEPVVVDLIPGEAIVIPHG